MDKQRRKRVALFAVVVAIATGVGVTHHSLNGPAPASVPAAGTSASPAQPAIDALMALPELKAWSAAIEKKSNGSAHGAVIAGDPSQQRTINGKVYQSFTFVESDPDAAHFWQGFYVTANGDSIIVDDPATGETMSVAEWRAKDHPLARTR